MNVARHFVNKKEQVSNDAISTDSSHCHGFSWIGETPDSTKFDDVDVDTLGHIAEACSGLDRPNMGWLGLSNIKEILGVKKIEAKSGRKVIGNKAASGTEIINMLGEKQMRTGVLIVYTSADSVMQIAAHETVVPLKELYEICEYCWEITLEDPYKIGRIIARPFVGETGQFARTSNRHDYALKPFGRTVMNELKDAGFQVIAPNDIKR